MKTREILIIVLFIIAVCVVSLIPFSNNLLEEGMETTPAITTFGNVTLKPTTTPAITTFGNVTLTTTPPITTKPTATTIANKTDNKITTNTDILNKIIDVTSNPPDNHNDKMSIYQIQGLISQLKTQNAATLLGEIGNPNNLSDPRLFLQYMNWFASHCPLDSNTCTGLC